MKSIFASKTFWGAISGLIISAASIFHVQLVDSEVQTAIEAAGALISAILVIYGRYTASKSVTLGNPNGTGMMWVVLLATALPLLSGCGHTGGAKEAHISFGVPMIFSVEKDITNLKVNEKSATVGDTSTKVTIGVFTYKSSGAGITLKENPTNERNANH